jgi:ElaA protein
METQVKSFEQLSLQELYDILHLRTAVFVVEQDCVYQDMDGKDQVALHVLGKEGGRLVAYTRVFTPGTYYKDASIGRVITEKNARGNGYGREIVIKSIEALEAVSGKTSITIAAQSYLRKFYGELGFKETGSEYLEDGIPHFKMVRS